MARTTTTTASEDPSMGQRPPTPPLDVVREHLEILRELRAPQQVIAIAERVVNS